MPDQITKEIRWLTLEFTPRAGITGYFFFCFSFLRNFCLNKHLLFLYSQHLNFQGTQLKLLKHINYITYSRQICHKLQKFEGWKYFLVPTSKDAGSRKNCLINIFVSHLHQGKFSPFLFKFGGNLSQCIWYKNMNPAVSCLLNVLIMEKKKDNRILLLKII